MCKLVTSLSCTPESNVTSSVIPDEQGPWEAAGGLVREAWGKQLVSGLGRSLSCPGSRAQGGGKAGSVLVERVGHCQPLLHSSVDADSTRLRRAPWTGLGTADHSLVCA